ncbi:helix-turn-helix domain-containing protein [Gordonia hydrophobica]|uniref:helix-turn-helix domain-containing protein n=1 Tax=Gordonia hydrophobica TaxID=40516 RepID=UPI0012ED03C3|nr:helix-turn-helix domain-containing protein [Gordonia hydrophobica]
MDSRNEVSGEIARLRRHTLLQRELIETAGELSSTTDEDTVIHTLIRRARQLIGTDLAYLMLVDPDRGDTYMRASDGAIGPAFDTIRLGRGFGLGGQVAQSMAPRWTRNYLRDQQYTHVIDPIVVEEGVMAILGAPVEKHGQLTGVLFVSDRSERDFTDDEVMLLTLLAEHASVTITAAARHTALVADLAASRAQLGEATRSNRRWRTTVELLKELTTLVREDTDAPALVHHLVSLIGGAAALYDDRRRLIDAAGEPGDSLVDVVRRVVDEGTASSPVGHTRVAVSLASTTADGREDAVATVFCTPVSVGSETLGVLGYASRAETEDIEEVLDHASALIALILLGQRARDEADNRLRGELLAEILAPTPNDLDTIERRAGLVDVDLSGDLIAVAVIAAEQSVSQALRAETTAVARELSGLVTSYSDGMALLIPGADPRVIARAAAVRLGQHGATVGTSGPTDRIDEVAGNVDAARSAARLLVALGRAGDGAATSELGMYGALFSDVRPTTLMAFVDQCLDPVRTYDRDHGTEIVHMLRVYFECEQSASATAEELFVHVNTVYQRLDRVDRILGPDWRTGDRSLEIQLALRLKALSTSAEN